MESIYWEVHSSWLWVNYHINEFQEAIRCLANAEFLLAEHVAAGMLLSTLPCDSNHPDSWDYFAKSTRVTCTTTTLAGIVDQILEEKRRQTAKNGSDTNETALARNAGAFAKSGTETADAMDMTSMIAVSRRWKGRTGTKKEEKEGKGEGWRGRRISNGAMFRSK